MNIIETENLNKYYGSGENRVHVLRDVTFSVQDGDFVAIIGQSGSGKSTLMNILGCLDTQSSGVCRIGGVDIGTLGSDELAELRGKRIGFIFQRYNLLSTLSATENVALPAIYAGVDRKTRLERARRLLGNLGLDDKLENRPNELSGGQQQRVSIARALMNGGSIILADEPTGALDSKSGENVMDILTDLNRQGHTIIVVTHDHHIAAFASRIIEIKDGAIISDTRSRDLLPQPEREETASSRASFLFRKDQFVEAFKMSVQAILAHKMRSVLTMLGIIIGIASVVSVVALGRGSQEKIIANISAMGTNTINVYPGSGFGDRRSQRVKTLTVADSHILGKQSYIASATPNTTSTGTLVYRNISVNAQLSGVGEQYFDVKGLKPAYGRFFNADDVKANASYVVIDDNTWKKLFPQGGNPVGQIILFDRQPLEIIAVAQKQDSVFGPTDTLNLWAPYTTVMNKITGQRHISSIMVKVKDDVMPLMAEKNLTALITARHGKTDFFTVNTDSIKKTIENTTGTMALLISGIALISLVVGGIGVMNIMLVSVTERTREIGLRMAIGAKQGNIMEQFLIEAVLICIIGGVLGIVVSYLIGVVFDMLVTNFAMSYSAGSMLLALVCSSAIGIVFGFVPARNASRLNPIDAKQGNIMEQFL
ncbi:MacB family efflux pump subunit, partial [uncultured Bilophila sp.]|uniref:MacB family efflux pump subunit n=1 Tax=uncultured Bilophila sp. TaxID=529385 RepID=UPI0025E0012C